MYPIIFRPIIKEMIWGSERWEISCRESEMGIVENGEYAGEEFADVCARNPERMLGTDFAGGGRFPLLVKIIDARDALSVQVHPDDEYARMKGENDSGKSEIWYILEPPTDGYLIIGLKSGVTREKLAKAYEDGTVEECLNRLKVERGDIINIPAGLIHALTSGTAIAEIQQNSDITYRLYDFGRVGVDGKPRPLHVSDALAVTDFDERIPKAAVPRGSNMEYEYFAIKKHVISASFLFKSDSRRFSIFTCVEGAAIFEGENFSVRLENRRSVFIPAGLGAFTVRAEAKSATLLQSEPNCPSLHSVKEKL
ncbi:MAG: class I mannose-6-phosphate isomerase [Defluviitaleaceae bacterium]|nr:class I mannose-6-phosphate isomerase [Defluviitaleaceae bacterium]